LEGDQAIFVEVKKVLSAYNPIYHARYQIAVKDGVVTVSGPAENQPEKDGVSNVIKMVAGVKDFKNNLTVKADAQVAGLPATTTATTNQTTAPTATPTTENNLSNQQAALEAERQRLAREADAQRQREAEFQRFREEEQQRRQRENERPRVAPAEPTPAPPVATTSSPRALRSGTVAWSGIVDGVDEIIITGNSASVRHRSGEAIREPRASFSAPVPRAPVNVKLLNQAGRGEIVIVQEPSAANGYTTIVRIDDTRENGGKPYQFTLRWTAE
ncbi:MAG: BON domain-containing protein, partial [Acidobacteria bacterium]|nr:BON domain-containing protein [Acidobacteriota bacterium]